MLEILRFSLISAIITAASAVVMWHFSKYDFSYKDIYNEGLELYKKRQYKPALNKFKLAVSKFPDQFNAQYNLGLCALKLKSFHQAKEAFNAAMALNGRDLDTIYNVAYTEMCLKNFERAKELFNSILKSYPDEADVLFNLGYIAKIEGDILNAKDFISNAVSINPKKNEYKRFYLDVLDVFFEQKGLPKILEEMLDLVLELLVVFPTDENLIYKTAVIYAKMGDWENSVTYCERMFSQNPNSYKACSQYGLTLFCKGDTSNAIEMYERAIKLAPDIPDSYLNLVFAYDKVGKFNLATKLVETFIKKFPDNEAIELAKDYLDRRAEEDNDELINDDKGLPQSISSRKKKQKELEENIAENSADVNSDAETDGTDEENA